MVRVLCFRPQRLLLASALLMNLLMLFYVAYVHDEMYFISERAAARCSNQSQPTPDYKLTIVIREFEDFETDLGRNVRHFLETFPSSVSVVILTETIPYPPINLPDSPRLQMVALDTDLSMEYTSRMLTNWVRSEFVLLVPDGVHLVQPTPDLLSELLGVLSVVSEARTGGVRIAAWPVDSLDGVQCLGLNVQLRQWTLQYYRTSGYCDAVSGRFVLLIKTADLFTLSSPFAQPIEDAMFIQTALRGWQVALQNEVLWTSSTKLYENPHSAWKHRSRQQQRRNTLYQEFGIKLVQHADGQEESFGCSKDSQRCFGTIHSDMPEFLYRGRWTPPCCLQALRTTARHVFRILDRQGVRYWLEGGSLLGAVRNTDIIPWDYDVDIGMYANDMSKSIHLMNAAEEPYEDEDGFVWEKASEGDFYRIQYSSTNHLHVDIFPFFSRNGTMTKNTWLKTHRQDMPFPEHFLQPMAKMHFVGVEVPVPNNADKFLELKFGEGVVANPRYPDLSDVTKESHEPKSVESVDEAEHQLVV